MDTNRTRTEVGENMAKKKRRRGRRKILPQIIDATGVIHAALSAAPAATGGDLEGAGKAFVGQLTANYSGYNAITGQMDLPALAIGYLPPIMRRIPAKLGFRINWPF